MKTKKAQGLSMETIIVAIIVLVVLVVLVLIFTGKIGVWSQDTNVCANKGGDCMSGSDCTKKNGNVIDSTGKGCIGLNQVCCIAVPA